LFNDLEENLKFHIVNNIFVDVDVDAKELIDVLSFRKHSQVDEDDDNDEINV
jgi:hypothetical protein